MTEKSFSAQVDEYVRKYEARMIAVARDASQEVIKQAQIPVAKGGKMRVDTGFLRASGQASLDGMPSGPIRGEKKEPNSYEPNESTVILTLANLKVGLSFFYGWTAAYARARETYDGFLASQVQNWQKIVDNSVRKMKAKIK